MSPLTFLLRTNFSGLLLGLISVAMLAPALRPIGAAAPALAVALATALGCVGAGVAASRGSASGGSYVTGMIAAPAAGLLAWHGWGSEALGVLITVLVMEWALVRSRPGREAPDSWQELVARGLFLGGALGGGVLLAGFLAGSFVASMPWAAAVYACSTAMLAASHRGCLGCWVFFGVFMIACTLSQGNAWLIWGPGVIAGLAATWLAGRVGRSDQAWP